MTDNRAGEACLALDETVLDALRERRSAGQSLKALAGEVGLSWQRLWSLLYAAGGTGAWPVIRPNAKAGSLTEKYRPLSLDTIWGQEQVVKILRKFAADPYPASFIFEGETGTGKTSAALALAAAVGCDLGQKEFGGVQTIASGEQSADAVREAYRQMHNCPWHGSGWKVVIVNEADRMARPAETIWLDVLETIPGKTVIIFTTNEADRLSQRFRDRCARLTFESDAAKLARSARQMLAAMWKRETGRNVDASSFGRLVEQATECGRLSFRRAVQLLSVELQCRAGNSLPADAKEVTQ